MTIRRFAPLLLVVFSACFGSYAQVGPPTPVNFKPYRYFPVINSPRNMGVADFNNDAQTDLAILSEDYASVVINDDGSLQNVKNFVHPSFYAPSFMNRRLQRGRAGDIFMAYNVDSIAILTNLGNGSLSSRISSQRSGIATIKAGDFNGDTRTDLAALSPIEKRLMILLIPRRAFCLR